MLETENIKIFWLGHASFRIESGGKIIYIDPWKIAGGPEADILLITHGHFDHFSQEDMDKVTTKGTRIVAPPDVADKLDASVYVAEPGSSFEIDGISIQAVRAYNKDKDFHPKENDWVGYVLNIGGERIYHAGDTDRIDEMEELENLYIALLPVSGTYVMTAEEAADAAKQINARITIPMHYGDIVGKLEDAQRFKELCADLRIEILEKE